MRKLVAFVMISAPILPILFFALQGSPFESIITQKPPTSTHCQAHEQKIFSCQIQKSQKILSLCAVANKPQHPGYLHYRFGNPGKVELQFPQSTQNTYAQFRWQTIGYSGGWDTRIQFANGGYRYQVYDRAIKVDMSHKDRSGGVLVYKGSKQVAQLSCQTVSFGADPYAWGLNDLYERVPEGKFFSE